MKVEVYGKAWCAYCDRTKVILGERGQAFDYYDVEADPTKMADLRLRAPGTKTVPQIFIDGNLIGGFDQLMAFYKNRK